MLAIVVAVAAICCGAFTSTALAEVSLRTPNSHQGRALGYVMSGQSLTLLVGIPVAAILGARYGWRGTHIALAGLALFAAAFMTFAIFTSKTPDDKAASKRRSNKTLGEALTAPIARLFVALAAERVCFGFATFYYASYLRTVYDLTIANVAIPLALFAIGNIVGTIIGGQVFNALSRPSILAAFADVPPDIRGVIMGLNSSVASIGWLTAALMGGWLYDSIGFASFGPVIAIMCALAAIIVVPDSRIRKGA